MSEVIATGTMAVILDWYKTLPKRARESMSFADLHSLSKSLRAAAPAASTAREEALTDALQSARRVLATALIASTDGLYDENSVGEHETVKVIDAALAKVRGDE